jgi:hypothetical protein
VSGMTSNLHRRILLLRQRVKVLATLRGTVKLPPDHDLSEPQWQALLRPLESLASRLGDRLERAVARYLPRTAATQQARKLSYLLGEIELEASRAFDLYDTYVDVLTQRHSPELGPRLRGCDALARDGLGRDHPALRLIEPPVVYCERGFGAAVLRSGVMLAGGVPNVAPLIQIPYERLKDGGLLQLTAIAHECGHEALTLTGLASTIAAAIVDGLERSGAPAEVASFFAHWASELGPDFWAFGCCGPGQAATLREFVALPPDSAFRMSMLVRHPPPFIRTLCSFDWCRQVWGGGPWDGWEDEWRTLYPLDYAPQSTRSLLAACQMAIPDVSRILLRTKFKVLGDRRIADLFDLGTLAPAALARTAERLLRGGDRSSRPMTELAAFRHLQHEATIDDADLNRRVAAWLCGLTVPRSSLNVIALPKMKVG